MIMSETYRLLTKYRFSILGVVLVWIFFRHTFFYNQFSFGLFDYLTHIGDCGVDIFLFMSGFGLYFSFSKDENVKSFYFRRLFRIIPTVVILVLLFAIIDGCLDINNGFREIISPSYWFFSFYSKNWFIGAILLFYVVYPLIYKFINKDYILTIGCSYLLAVLGIAVVHMLDIKVVNQLALYFARIPIFILGSVFAMKQNLFDKKYLLFFLFLMSIPLLYCIPKIIQRLFYGFITLYLVTCIPYGLKLLPSKINTYLSFIGKLSLEFYLIHIYLLSNNALDRVNKIVSSEILTSLIVLVGVIILAYICNIIISKLTGLIKNDKKI